VARPYECLLVKASQTVTDVLGPYKEVVEPAVGLEPTTC